ncbi:hypothetical protein PR202_ga03043 [Eleusine coracana subsp. coracana]|uniref:Uncharacterized protein n=1 Tax=Eleusine coracana subsp. coracana TaxID=191504 RepID=A0AAV5BL18_ELECO|nr:hypothetical protein PR202_ga03043 [Eleusine coracana subsp. coracana]
MLRFFGPDENVGGGGGVELTTLPLRGGPGGGGGGRIVDVFCEALLSTDSFGGGNGVGVVLMAQEMTCYEEVEEEDERLLCHFFDTEAAVEVEVVAFAAV